MNRDDCRRELGFRAVRGSIAIQDKPSLQPSRPGSCSEVSDPIISSRLRLGDRSNHACWSCSPMPRREQVHAVCGTAWLIGLFFAAGCVHSTRELQDRLAERVRPVEVGAVHRRATPRLMPPVARRRTRRLSRQSLCNRKRAARLFPKATDRLHYRQRSSLHPGASNPISRRRPGMLFRVIPTMPPWTRLPRMASQ